MQTTHVVARRHHISQGQITLDLECLINNTKSLHTVCGPALYTCLTLSILDKYAEKFIVYTHRRIVLLQKTFINPPESHGNVL